MNQSTRVNTTSRRFADAIAAEIEAACGTARGLTAVVELFSNTDMRDMIAGRPVRVSLIPQGCGIVRATRGSVLKSPQVLMTVQARAEDVDGRDPEEFCAMAEELASALVATGAVDAFNIVSADTNGEFIKEDYDTAGIISVPVVVIGNVYEDIVRLGTGATTR